MEAENASTAINGIEQKCEKNSLNEIIKKNNRQEKQHGGKINR